MMLREIRDDQQGGVYSSQVTIVYEDQSAPGRRLVFHCDPDGLYDLMHKAVGTAMTLGASDNPEEKKRKNLARLLKAGVKGLLIAFGNDVLDVLIGPNHPKLPKGADVVDWYQDIFTQIGLSWLMKNDTILQGSIVDGSIEQAVIGIGSVSSRPVTEASEGIRAGDPAGIE